MMAILSLQDQDFLVLGGYLLLELVFSVFDMQRLFFFLLVPHELGFQHACISGRVT